jgi:hypothetical protein
LTWCCKERRSPKSQEEKDKNINKNPNTKKRREVREVRLRTAKAQSFEDTVGFDNLLT